MAAAGYEPLVHLTISLHNLIYVVIHDCLVLCNKFRTRESRRLETPFKLYVAVAISQLACDC